MIKTIKLIRFYLMLVKLDSRKKTSLYRMIYWKTHWDGIPPNEKKELLNDGWLISYYDFEGNLSYKWSGEAYKIIYLLENDYDYGYDE